MKNPKIVIFPEIVISGSAAPGPKGPENTSELLPAGSAAFWMHSRGIPCLGCTLWNAAKKDLALVSLAVFHGRLIGSDFRNRLTRSDVWTDPGFPSSHS